MSSLSGSVGGRSGSLVDPREQARDDDRNPEQPDREAHREHDHRDAKAEADNHQDETDHAGRRVLEKPPGARQGFVNLYRMDHDVLSCDPSYRKPDAHTALG